MSAAKNPSVQLLVGALLLGSAPLLLAGEPTGATPIQAVAAGSSWVVDHTTHLTSLTIGEGARVSAAPGHSVSLTVDGTSLPMVPGFYEGNVVLTVTDEIIVNYRDQAPHHFRAAVYVDDGKLVADKSVLAAVAEGEVTDTSAKNVSITSNDDRFNGIWVTGNSRYLIDHPVIYFTGNGGDDFAGFGAALMSTGHAEVTVEKAHIVTRGAVRTAVFVGGDSTMHVNDSFIDVYNGVLPANYKFNISLGGMFEAPWILGLIGNVRATNIVDNGTVYYDNSTIRTHGWGALSSDDPKHIHLYATNSTIETVGSGYGSYAIGDSLNHFSHCTFKVADVALIIAGGGSADFTDGTVVNSGRYGVMMHSGSGGTLTIDKGSAITSQSTAIEVKSRAANIIVDGASINAKNGIILQAMVNDDPYADNPAAAAAVGVPIMAGSFVGPPRSEIKDVVATFRNVTLQGDFINSMTKLGSLNLTFEKASVTGAISSATAAPSSGQAPTRATYYLIGDVTNTLAESLDKHGVSVSLDGDSSWVVAKSSYLTSLKIAKGAKLSAPSGQTLTLWVDGARKPLHAGHYAGHIELSVKGT